MQSLYSVKNYSPFGLNFLREGSQRMEIKRPQYLNQLISLMWNGQIKVVTGIRRSGKSYLLRTLFRNYLLGNGVKAENIISVYTVPQSA